MLRLPETVEATTCSVCFLGVDDAPQPSMRLAASLHDAAASANDLRQLGELASADGRS